MRAIGTIIENVAEAKILRLRPDAGSSSLTERRRGLLEVTDHYSLVIVIGRHPDRAT
jgi:hypothetical protein